MPVRCLGACSSHFTGVRTSTYYTSPITARPVDLVVFVPALERCQQDFRRDR